LRREKLLPCPFCGGKAHLEESGRGFIGGKSEKVAYVWCERCNARSGKIKLSDFGRTSHSAEAVKQAVELWNKREQ